MAKTTRTAKAIAAASTVAIVIVLAAAGILVSVRFYNLTTARYTAERVYRLGWHVTIPDDYSEIRHYTSEHGFDGKGYRYTVFKTAQNGIVGVGRDTSMGISDIQTGVGVSAGGGSYDIADYIDEITEELDVEDDDIVVLSSDSRWKRLEKTDGSILAIISDPHTGLVYFAEKLL
jgi:hypothetical protein